jgi:hypothetical protein
VDKQIELVKGLPKLVELGLATAASDIKSDQGLSDREQHDRAYPFTAFNKVSPVLSSSDAT